MFDKGVKQPDFIEFLQHLRQINGEARLHVFLDNMKAHKGTDVGAEFERQNIVPIWNVPYRCELQPIELVFAQVKRVYKRNKLNAFMNGKEFVYKNEI